MNVHYSSQTRSPKIPTIIVLTACALAGLALASRAATVVKEIPVTFAAADSVRFSVEVIDESLPGETLALIMPDSSIAHLLTSSGEVGRHED